MGSGIVSQLVPTSIGGLFGTLASFLVAYQVCRYAYNILFHPLRKFPGPTLAAASALPLISQSLRGTAVFWITEQHKKYGEVVRISPHELSFAGAEAHKDIHGHKKAGQASFEKDPMFYNNPTGEVDIINADYDGHARMRRVFSHAFSDRALKQQETLFLTYVDRLVEKIREGVRKVPKQKFNMVQMLNFTTFDVMGDLTFGEPLDMLANEGYHPWVAAILAGFKFGVYLHSMRYFPAIEKLLLRYCIPESLRQKMKLHNEFSKQRVDRRLEKQDARPDIWGLVLERDEQSGLSKEEMYANSQLFMIAGTETTATALSGLIYYLVSKPVALQRLVGEVRTTFTNESDITIERLQALPYLHACLEEGLRMFPPVSNGLPRLTPPGALSTVDGHEVPPKTRVMYTHLAAYRSSVNWRDPYDFVPERWLGSAPDALPYVNDKRGALIPFSTGPRGCLGKNMAYHEMRLILTKLLWHFDLKLCPESEDWARQKIFIMWEKPPLYCQLVPVRS